MAVKKAAAKIIAPVGPPSRLSKLLESLKSGHQPQLADVKGLKLKYAYRNDHWGARHFVKNDLPRITYLNPKVKVEVDKALKTREEVWKPEMVVELRDGTKRTIDMDKKWSSTIYEELMEVGGGSAWAQWKEERIAAGLPIVEIPRPKAKATQSTPETPLPFRINPLKTGAAAMLP
ncbi:hypothetical protein BDY19DRAFT_888569 [Irpex rosettiformis]|uniref:Uncharacterized protein n=1 Tax=Irpex rosettiformis TaxID=378272 RepID=A0ACB8U6L6_9APHY|nr:hypothetical protein BDY19DRAFT_888569 [Irpex rosettiformis]